MKKFFYFVAAALMAVSCSSFEASEQVSNDVATKGGLINNLTGSIWGQSTGCVKMWLDGDYNLSRMELYCIYFVFTSDTTGYAFYGNDVRMEGYKAVAKWNETFSFTYKLVGDNVKMSEVVMPDVRTYYKTDGVTYQEQHIALGRIYYDEAQDDDEKDCLMIETNGNNDLSDLQLISQDFDFENMTVPESDWLDDDKATKAGSSDVVTVAGWSDVSTVVEL